MLAAHCTLPLLAPSTGALLQRLGFSVAAPNLATWQLAVVSDGLYTAESDAAVILHHRSLLARRDRTSNISSMMKRMVSVLLHVIRSRLGGETALPCEILT